MHDAIMRLTPHRNSATGGFGARALPDGENEPSCHAALAEAIEAVGFGVVLTTADSFILFANGVARELMSKGEGLRSNSGWLATTSAELTAKLREKLRSGMLEPAAAALILERGKCRQPLLMHVMPLGRGRPAGSQCTRDSCAAIVIIDPERYAAASFEAYAKLHGLTDAEGRVLRGIVGGKGLVVTAAMLGVRQATVRTHMKRIFEKTGTHRQTELICAFFKATLPAKSC
jgi:DNA-binding CsgD family transcriptional regulator